MKKIVCILLVFSMLFALAACGSSAQTTESKAVENIEPENAEAFTAETTGTETPPDFPGEPPSGDFPGTPPEGFGGPGGTPPEKPDGKGGPGGTPPGGFGGGPGGSSADIAYSGAAEITSATRRRTPRAISPRRRRC